MESLMLTMSIASIFIAAGVVILFLQSRDRIILREVTIDKMSERQHQLLQEKVTILNMEPGETQMILNRLWASKVNRYLSDLEKLTAGEQTLDLEDVTAPDNNVLHFPERRR